MRFFIICLILFFSFVFASEKTAAQDYQYLIRVSIDQRTLFLHKTDNETKILTSFPVAVPKENYYPLPMHGMAESIEIDPYWYPLEQSRALYLRDHGEELPNILPPGDPRNAMGKAKININWETTQTPFKIHGTNNPASIGKKATGGCIRLKNENILELAKMLKGAKIKVCFEN